MDWDELNYDLGIANIALFGWVLLIGSDYLAEYGKVAEMLAVTFGLGLMVVGLVLLLIRASETLLYEPEQVK